MAGHAGRSPPFRLADAGVARRGAPCRRTQPACPLPGAGRAHRLAQHPRRAGHPGGGEGASGAGGARGGSASAAPRSARSVRRPGRPGRRRPRHGGGASSGGSRSGPARSGGRRRRPPAVGGDGGAPPSAGLGAAAGRPDAPLDPFGAPRRPGRDRLRVGDLEARGAGRLDRLVPRGPRRRHRPRGPLPQVPPDARRPCVRAGPGGPAHGGGAGGGRLGGALFRAPRGGLHPCRPGDRRPLPAPRRLDLRRARQRPEAGGRDGAGPGPGGRLAGGARQDGAPPGRCAGGRL